MQLHNCLDKLLNNDVQVALLRTLCLHYSSQRSGRQLARDIGTSPTTVNKFLRRLVEEDVVTVVISGHSNLYSINRDNYAVSRILMACFKNEREVFPSLVSIIKKILDKSGDNVVSACIFGSVASKKQTPKSDIDLLVVVSDLKFKDQIRADLDELGPKVAKEYHTAISPYILSTQQVKMKAKEKAPLINEILKSHILISGKPVERIII